MSNVVEFPQKKEQKPKVKYTLTAYGPRQEIWTPFIFGISYLVWGSGSNIPPDFPPPSGGTPAANRPTKYSNTYAIAA